MVSPPTGAGPGGAQAALRELGLLQEEHEMLADRMKELAAAGFESDVVRV